MSTPIQPVPDVVLAPEFPTPADRQAGIFNQKAFEWANGENAMSERNREIALTAHTNATAAHEQAQAANTARLAAQAAAGDAQTAADAAAATAGATKWDAAEVYPEGAVVWSPITMQSYRRRVAGSGGDDPSLDAANWEFLGGVEKTGGTATDITLKGSITEEVYALTGTTPALDPANGTIQTWTLAANSSPTDGLASGQSMTLFVDDGSAYSITWPSINWIGGTAPTLKTTGYTIFVLWKIGAQLYGTKAGEVA